MDSPEDNEEYKIEYQLFQSKEQLIESHRKCNENRAEWKLKDVLLENYKKEKEERMDAGQPLSKIEPESDTWFSPPVLRDWMRDSQSLIVEGRVDTFTNVDTKDEV